MDNLYIIVNIKEIDIVDIEVGNSVDVVVDGDFDIIFDGIVEEIGYVINLIFDMFLFINLSGNYIKVM